MTQTDKKKVKEALRIVNKSIESMMIKGMDMSTGAGVWWKLDMEKIKKLLESQSDILYRKNKKNIEKRVIINIKH